MKTLFVVLATLCTGNALADKPAKAAAAPENPENPEKWDCLVRGAESKPFAVVEATDLAKANTECKATWGKLDETKRAALRPKRDRVVEDDLFSKRNLEK